MSRASRLSLGPRIVVFFALYIAAIGFLYGFQSVAANPLVLLWPVAAFIEFFGFLVSIAHWSNDMVTNGVGALLLLYFAVVMVRFLTGKIGAVTLLSIALGLIFVYAAIPKILEAGDFARDIRNYRILPVWSYNLVALWLPWIELLGGLGLVSGIWKKGGAMVLLVMLVVFTAAVISAVVRGLDIDCGCFGHTAGQIAKAHLVGTQKIIENLAMIVVAFFALLPVYRRRVLKL
jgi:putative oxidoreductase